MTEQAPSQVRLEDALDQPTVAVRVQVAMSDLDIGALFSESMRRLSDHVAAVSGDRSGPPYARYHEFGPDQADIEFGIPVQAPIADLPALDDSPAGEIGTSVLPGGSRAVTMHVGSYPELGNSYARLENWMKENGHTGRAGPWESYLVLPGDVGGDPTGLRTDVSWPVA